MQLYYTLISIFISTREYYKRGSIYYKVSAQFDISPCDKPLCFRRSFKFNPNITFTSCYIFYHRYRKKSKQRILTFRVNPYPAAPRHGPGNLLRRPRKNQPPLPPPAYMIPQNPTQKAPSERILTAPSTNTVIPYGFSYVLNWQIWPQSTPGPRPNPQTFSPGLRPDNHQRRRYRRCRFSCKSPF